LIGLLLIGLSIGDRAKPLRPLIINVTGSLLIGALVGMFATRWDLPPAARIFLTVGICGGYTTFSTFSLDA
jgi:CrcB protein